MGLPSVITRVSGSAPPGAGAQRESSDHPNSRNPDRGGEMVRRKVERRCSQNGGAVLFFFSIKNDESFLFGFVSVDVSEIPGVIRSVLL